MNWTEEKPVFDKQCLLITASKVRDMWEYSLWLITKVYGETDGWYWGWLTSDGEEYGDLNDLKADLYCVLDLLENS